MKRKTPLTFVLRTLLVLAAMFGTAWCNGLLWQALLPAEAAQIVSVPTGMLIGMVFVLVWVWVLDL